MNVHAICAVAFYWNPTVPQRQNWWLSVNACPVCAVAYSWNQTVAQSFKRRIDCYCEWNVCPVCCNCISWEPNSGSST